MRLKKWMKNSSINKEKEIVQELTKESFKIKIRKNAALEFSSEQYLADKIRMLISKYDSKYYGPFTTLCQSSGFGKSRACEALVNQNFYVVYCCLRAQNSTGYPPRSCLANYLTMQEDTKTKIKIYKSYLNLFIDLLKNSEINCSDFLRNQSEDKKDQLKKLMEDKLRQTCHESKLSVYTDSRPLVFIFDESSSLLGLKQNDYESNYFVLRRVLSELGGNVFVLFLDTFTNLSEFQPAQFSDPSERVYNLEKILFEPIYLLPNWDLFVDYNCIENIFDTVKFENICRFGRVLWGSWMFTKQNSNGRFQNVSDEQIFNVAISKLIGGRAFAMLNLNDNECIAVLSCRIGTIRLRQISTNQNLVANNMAVCTYVDTRKAIFDIEYPSEPILAMAAASLMHEFGFDKIIDTLIKSVESSLIAKGERGEAIAKLILIHTIDHLTRKKHSQSVKKYLNLTRVGEFIQELYGKCQNDCGCIQNEWKCQNVDKNVVCPIRIINEQLIDSTELLNGFLNFNHFTKPNCWLKKASLQVSLKRCAAIHCKSMQPAIDLVIPVCLDSNNFDSLSAIIIQVKLTSEPLKPDYMTAFDGISSKMFHDLDSKKPYIMLFMQLGQPKLTRTSIENIKMVSQRGAEHSKRTILYTEGISKNIFPNLTENVIQKLKKFAYSSEKLFEEKAEAKIHEIIRFAIRE